MKFESAALAAQRLNVSVRAVQKWAKEGKIPGAKKVGRDWHIPINIDIDDTIDEEKVVSLYERTPVSLLNCVYENGTCEAFIDSIVDIDERNIKLAEYYYYSGKMEEASSIMEPYLTSENPNYRYIAAMLCTFANLTIGNTLLTRYCIDITQSDLYDELHTDVNVELKALAIFTSSATSILLHIPVEGKPLLSLYLKHLPDGMKMFGAYIIAHRYYLEKDYIYSLGLAKMALAIYGDKYIIPSIYLHIMIAIDLMNLLRIEEAMEHMEIAWQLAKEDHIIAPFAQHYSLLQGLVDRFFKKNHPELFEMTVKAAMRFGAGWIKIHNEDGKKTVTKELNALEFTIAMLYNRNWRIKEIAFHLEMSERTVKNYLSTIYEKLDISSRKELRQYMLQ